MKIIKQIIGLFAFYQLANAFIFANFSNYEKWKNWHGYYLLIWIKSNEKQKFLRTNDKREFLILIRPYKYYLVSADFNDFCSLGSDWAHPSKTGTQNTSILYRKYPDIRSISSSIFAGCMTVPCPLSDQLSVIIEVWKKIFFKSVFINFFSNSKNFFLTWEKKSIHNYRMIVN